jgi:hypothetical protein
VGVAEDVGEAVGVVNAAGTGVDPRSIRIDNATTTATNSTVPAITSTSVERDQLLIGE